MTTKLFISYRSLDSAKVDTLVSRLRSLKRSDGTPLYSVWQDKTHIPPGQDWWKSIIEGIVDCDIFVYMISHESVKNINCRAELSYARKRNRPIIPLVLEGEFDYNPVTAKTDIDYWSDVPEELRDARFQFLFYEGGSFVNLLNQAVTRLNNLNLRDMPAPEPPDPRNANDATNDTGLIYDQACEYAWRMEFAAAEKRFQRLVDWQDPLFSEEAYEWILLLRNYEQILRLDKRTSTRHKARSLWPDYRQQFPKVFTPLFDPADLHARYQGTDVKKDPTAEAIRRALAFKGKRNADWEPYITTFSDLKIPDMRFCLVPPGTFQMGSNDGHWSDEEPVHPQTIEQPFWIAQYPITNAQWRLAVEAGAVPEPHNVGSALKWYNAREMADAPVVGVTWFMVQDFMNWLGGRFPTEREWEYAARGVESWRYPWGNDWQPDIPVWKENSNGQPASVTTRPEGKSWTGAWHMSGNVWEWTSSHYKSYPYKSEDGREDVNRTDVSYVVRGGSGGGFNPNNLRAACRANYTPDSGTTSGVLALPALINSPVIWSLASGL